MLLAEEDMVRVSNLAPGTRLFRCPATRLAEEIGKRMVLNIVMIGFFAAVTQLVKPESLRRAVAESVPEHFMGLNLKAFDKGFERGQAKLRDLPGGEPIESYSLCATTAAAAQKI
jgi:2-oxoglutarate ferredoxin oxidoreductase subunit gamma